MSVKSKKLPFKTFLKTFKFVPRVAVNLYIKDNLDQILLTKRKIPPFKDYWHIPGSFLLKKERIKDCIERVAKEELGIKLRQNRIELLGVFENLDKDERGHVIDIIYGLKINSSLKSGRKSQFVKFFRKLPPNIGFNHEDYLKKLNS